ncbi:MAG TPA: RNA 2',3'-cyclic phosphodiesterase [Pedococcus sp.]|nr:RNA 2',3'-cyclic phosphodiesterase [Nocardioidaceae bacterium]HEX5428833.1 RNA 2',3'-cyclic phosphodiesterase [Pedococcus sp.]
MRMFVALVPPPESLEDLAGFLGPRQEAGTDLRWTVAEQWHVTLAFLADVAERHLDDLGERLTRAAARRTCFEARVHGAGAFPNPAHAKVLYLGVDAGADQEELRRLATGARAAASKAGAEPDGGRFRAHLTLARTRHPLQATRWIRVLDAYQGPTWQATEIALIESHLGEGPRKRPRYEVLETFPLRTAIVGDTKRG